MIRVLYIARYRNATMERKIALLAAQPDLVLWLVRPSVWQDEYGRIAVDAAPRGDYRVTALPLLGRANDPHRALYRTLTFTMRAARPDIVHAEEEPDSLAALQIILARQYCAPSARLILHTWQNINRPKGWPVRWVLRTTLSHADAVLCANGEALTVLSQEGYDGVKAVILPQGVDLQVFKPSGAGLPSAILTVVYAGRFVPEKGLDILIEAVRLAGPAMRLYLIGDGPLRSALQATVYQAHLEDRVEFVPPMSSGSLASKLGQSDALVLPSRTTPVWKEQFGRILVEAMACRVPVVGSDSGAIPEVIGDAGLIFPEGDAVALADCLQRLAGSPSLRAELADRGYARAASLYSQEHVAEQTATFYRQMMAKG